MKGYKAKILIWVFFVFLLIGNAKPVAAELILTQEERDYIDQRGVITAASIDGGAPLHYSNSKGEILGIAVNTLDKIAEMTGLQFDYKLYETIDDVFESDTDIIFGITPNYAPEGMILSQPYLKSETILFLNASLDPNQLDNKRFAQVKGGIIPDGIEEVNTIFYKSREETLNAVEKGKADYGYGNEYSVAFYTIQNAYKNIITIPKAMETRAYSIGFPKKDQILLTIINKAIAGIEDYQMNQIILETASEIESKMNFSMIMDKYGAIISAIILMVIGILSWGIISNIHVNKNLSLQNKRYELLAQISNEYLFEYYIKTDDFNLSKKSIDLFGTEENLNEAINNLKDIILDKNSNENIEITSLPLDNCESLIFKVIHSPIYEGKGKVYSIIGKLIDISEEVAEKEELIIKSEVDGLTGLYNQITIKTLINESINNKKTSETHALILMDCDEFKNINDTFGHLAGDRALKNVSVALKNKFRGEDIIGRIGGDEFCVYMKEAPSRAYLQTKCEKLIIFVKEMDKVFNLTLSIGIAFSKDESQYEDLFKKADMALYEAKKTGRAKVVVFDSELEKH